MWSVLRLVLLLGVLAGGLATAGAAFGDSGTTVTKGHFEYQLFDESIGMYVKFVCNGTRVETGNAVRETIHCKTNDYTHRSARGTGLREPRRAPARRARETPRNPGCYGSLACWTRRP